MLIEVVSDAQLGTLVSSPGFLVNVDYPTRDVKLHSIRCKYCDPRRKIGGKPSSKNLNKTGEFWFSASCKEAASKAIQIADTRGYTYQVCPFCNPLDIHDKHSNEV